MRLPGRYATVRRQIWQRVTGSWVTVTGKGREGDLLIYLYDASPDGLTLHGAHAARSCLPDDGRMPRPEVAVFGDQVTEALARILGPDLVGVYFVGSVALMLAYSSMAPPICRRCRRKV